MIDTVQISYDHEFFYILKIKKFSKRPSYWNLHGNMNHLNNKFCICSSLCSYKQSNYFSVLAYSKNNISYEADNSLWSIQKSDIEYVVKSIKIKSKKDRIKNTIIHFGFPENY